MKNTILTALAWIYGVILLTITIDSAYMLTWKEFPILHALVHITITLLVFMMYAHWILNKRVRGPKLFWQITAIVATIGLVYTTADITSATVFSWYDLLIGIPAVISALYYSLHVLPVMDKKRINKYDRDELFS